MAGKRFYFLIKDINFVTVPLYDELTPTNIMKKMGIIENSEMYNKLLQYCPEIKTKGSPKDRNFFFNVLNTV